MNETIHAPPNAHAIEIIYVFLSVDDDGDGICAMQLGDTMMPMIVSSPKMFEAMKTQARDIAALTGKRVVLAKFSVREDVWSTLP